MREERERRERGREREREREREERERERGKTKLSSVKRGKLIPIIFGFKLLKSTIIRHLAHLIRIFK